MLGGEPLRPIPFAARVIQGIHQEPKLWPEICLAHNFHAMVQAWGTQVGPDAGGGQGDGCPCEGPIGFSVLGFQPKLEVFHSGFYKKLCNRRDRAMQIRLPY